MFRVLLVAFLGLAAIPAAGAEIAGTPASRSSAAATPELRQLIGFVDGALVRIDPESFRALPRSRVSVGSGGCAPRQGGTACWSNPPWAVAPTGRQLVVARNDAASLLVVDAERLRTTARIPVEGGAIGALAWLAPRRLLALQEVPGERQRLLALDVATRRIVARSALTGSVQQIAKGSRDLVLLLAPTGAIGPARLTVVGRTGAVRSVLLARVRAGSRLHPTPQHRVDSRMPGLAVDPQRRRAYVVDQNLVAEIDLRTLAVAYHSLSRPPSLLGRLWNWLEPKASAKFVDGYRRQASYVGNGVLAVAGSDAEQGRLRAAGLVAVDTRSWEIRQIDRAAWSARVAGALVLAWGERNGLAAYDSAGAQRFHLFAGESTWVAQVYRGRAYVGISGSQDLRVVDLQTGAAVGARQSLPWLLLGSGDGWWGV